MLRLVDLFEISVYRLDEAAYFEKMSKYAEKFNSISSNLLSDTYSNSRFGGDWRYNEIIGFLRFYRYGDNKIRCEYWETDAKKKVRTRKKMFVKRTDKYCDEIFHITSSNANLAQSMKDAVMHCEFRLKRAGRVLDRSMFDNTVDFIDWKSLLR